MNGKEGFTMIEMIVVICILAIITAISTPSMIKWRGEASINKAVSDLYGDLNRANTRAIRENALVVLEFTANNSYIIYLDNGLVDNDLFDSTKAKDWEQSKTEKLVTSRNHKTGIVITSNALDPDKDGRKEIGIDSKGHLRTITGDEVILTFAKKNLNSKALRINRLGFVTVEE